MTATDGVVVATALGSRVRTITGAARGPESPPTLDETYTRMRVDETLVGTIPPTVEVSQIGSVASGTDAEDAPLLEKGQNYLLFLQKGPFGYGATGGTAIYEKKGGEFRRTATPDKADPGSPDTRRPSAGGTPIPEVIPVAEVRRLLSAVARPSP